MRDLSAMTSLGSASTLQRFQFTLIVVLFTALQTSAFLKNIYDTSRRKSVYFAETISKSSGSCDNQISDQQDRRIRDILTVASAKHAKDVAASIRTNMLAEHTFAYSPKEIIPYKWWQDDVSVIETTRPVLNDNSRQLILQSALQYWEEQKQKESMSEDSNNGGGNSRFTLQGPNKRELHASDLPSEAIETINDALGSIYPMLRESFGEQVEELCHNEKETATTSNNDWSLLLYDALVIEYDASSTEHLLPVSERPAQPLHRDLGLFSVNIALDDPSQFEGGGTIFERRFPMGENFEETEAREESLSSPTTCSILPREAGYAVAHPCRERHAGGALISGRRTILVLFVTGTRIGRDDDANVGALSSTSCPKLELAGRCKVLGMSLGGGSEIQVPSEGSSSSSTPPLNGKEDQILCYRAAVKSDPTDGEAWLYLGMALLSKPPCDSLQDQIALYEEIVECFDTAKTFNPTDGRVYNMLGIALQQQQQLMQFASAELDASKNSSPKDYDNEIPIAFAKAATIHKHAALMGCMGAAVEARSALLNWGSWHANRDEFDKAVPILRQICVDGIVADTSPTDPGADETLDKRAFEAKRVVHDATRLLIFCEKQLNKSP